MNTRNRLVLCLALLTILVGACFAQSDPWEAPAFSGEPAAMVRAASSITVPEGTDVICLLHEVRYVFEADGRKTYIQHFVYRIMTERGVEGAPASVDVFYEPWHEQRPVVRARVITSDGVVHPLDTKTLDDAPAEDGDETYTDRRVLRGPLPAVAVGAIVEKEYTTSETAPAFDVGTTNWDELSRSYPVRHSKVTIDAPASLPLRYRTELLPAIKVEKTDAADRVVVAFDQGNLDADKELEPFLPGDTPTWPLVMFSTANSWQAVAARYAQLVDQRIAAGKAPMTKVSGKTREQIAAELLARLHREARYTGVEFGEAAFVPQSPAEVLKRKYGDCKDKATLLVAMLRDAGIPAYLALLNTGPGRDVHADMPGFGEFNHAIVYVPGGPELWIDATAEFARLGQLPAGDQGRLALIIRPETTGLVRTPETVPSDNLVVETREFFLSENGPARVVETTEAFGVPGLSYRSGYDGPITKDIRESLTNYTKDIYKAGGPPKIEHSDPRDFSGPFRLRLEVDKAKRGNTTLTDASVSLPIWNLITRLPKLFTESSDDKESESADKPKRRQSDLVMPEPFVGELRYRIVAPPGFKPSPLPDSKKTQMGPAILTREYTVKDDVVTATIRFDTVKRRYTADEVETVKAAVRELSKTDMTVITFEQIGHSYLAAGKVHEALTEYNKLIALHPKEALHHMQIARAYLQAGVGEAARAEARRATELEPKSADAFGTLGWILQHDLVGRRMKKGFDLAGAVAAYRKALELDLSDMDRHIDFAILLEHNADGTRYGPGFQGDEALAQYKIAKSKLEESGYSDYADNPLFVLMHLGRYAELKEAVQALSSNSRRRAFTLVAIAATAGAPAAIKEAEKIASAQDRSNTLTTAAQMLLTMRLYPQAADLLEAGARGTEQATNSMARAQIIRRARRYEEIIPPATDPRFPYFTLQSLLLGTRAIGPEAFDLFSELSFDPGEKQKQLEEFRATGVKTRLAVEKQGLDPQLALEVGMSALQITIEGDDATGYRLRQQNPGQRAYAYFIVRERGGYRLLGIGSELSAVGKRALALAEKGELDHARRLLDWAREEESLAGGDDPLAGRSFPRFWTKGQDGDADAVRYAAAALASSDWDAAKTIPTLQQGRDKTSNDTDRVKFDLALANAYTATKRWDDLLATGRELLKAYPTSASAFALTTNAMMYLGKWQEWEQLAQERLKRLPDDVDALRSLAHAKSLEGDSKGSQEFVRRLISLGKAEVQDYNGLVWSGLLDGTLTDEVIQTGYRSTMNTTKDAPMLHTLAAAYAEVGKTIEAREMIIQAMDVWGVEEPNSEAWYVFGRIAEQYGAIDAARAAYSRVEAPRDEQKIATVISTWALAQRRVKAMGPRTAVPE